MALNWNLRPQEIEEESFSIIRREAGNHSWAERQWPIIERLVHSSVDFDYVSETIFSPTAIEGGIAALREGVTIITDTKMALCGLNLPRLQAWQNKAVCLINDERTQRRAREAGTTRSLAAVDLACELFFRQGPGGIWVIGNSPTALFRLLEKIETEPMLSHPRLIVGFPMGFVNASESKEALSRSSHNFITNLSRKGGSHVAAAVINALAEMAANTI